MSDDLFAKVAPVEAALPVTLASLRSGTTVVVEAGDDGCIWIHRYRGDAAMSEQRWDRAEAEMLYARLGAALQVSK